MSRHAGTRSAGYNFYFSSNSLELTLSALGKSWSFHLFPLFDLVSYHPKHFLWQVLGGLVGHESQADSERWRAGWVWMDPTGTP